MNTVNVINDKYLLFEFFSAILTKVDGLH